jgi:hypothetical protein
VKYWEIIADNLRKAGWSLGWVSALDCEGRTIWIADAHRDDGKHFIVRADKKLTAFHELQSAIRFGSHHQHFKERGGSLAHSTSTLSEIVRGQERRSKDRDNDRRCF